MALKMQQTFSKYGIISPDAYFKIGHLQVLEEGGGWGIRFEVKAYFSLATKNNGSAPIETYYYTMNYDTTGAGNSYYNLVKCAYTHLKTQSEFSTAVDA